MTISSINFCSTWQVKNIYQIKNFSIKKTVELVELETGKRYKNDSIQEIANKALLVFLFNPIVLFLKIAFNLFQMTFDFVKITKQCFNEINTTFREKKINKIFKIFVDSLILLSKYLFEDAICIIKAPFFSLAIEIASIFTIFIPIQGRKIISDLERLWNQNKSSKLDYRLNKDAKTKPFFEFLWSTLKNRNENVAFYMALCFQPIGNLKDRHIIWYSNK